MKKKSLTNFKICDIMVKTVWKSALKKPVTHSEENLLLNKIPF